MSGKKRPRGRSVEAKLRRYMEYRSVTGFTYTRHTDRKVVAIAHEKTGTKFGEYDLKNKIFKLIGGGWVFDCTWEKLVEVIRERVASE
jgi:hypothetical protein